MIIVYSEYIFINPKLNEIKDIITNTRLKYDRKNEDNCCDKIEIKCNIKFFDKFKNKTKIVTIKIYHLHGIKKTMIASQRRYELLQPNKLIILIEGIFSKNVINTYMKCNNIPILWIIFFFKKTANNGDYVYNFCKRPFNDFHRNCREW